MSVEWSAWGAVGVSGTFGVIAASLLWVATSRQAVARRTTELRTAILAGAMEVRAGMTPAVARPAGGPDLVASPAMVHYHRADCRLAAGKPVAAAGRADHEQTGRSPCGVCLAGTPPDPRGGP